MPKTPKTIVIFAMVPTLAIFVCSTFSVATGAPQQGTSIDDEAGKSICIPIYFVRFSVSLSDSDFLVPTARQSSSNRFLVGKLREIYFYRTRI